jgi:hypothetical protein
MTNNEIRKHIRQFYDLGLLAFPFKLYRDQQTGKKAYSIRNAIGEAFRWQEEKHLVDLAFAESILDKIRCTAIAAYCGSEHNLIVVDIDKKGGKDGFEALTDAGLLIPDNVPSVSTPSGGLHYLFAFPDELKSRQTVWQFDNGIDIQGDNSITLLPPSMYPGGVYDWVTPIDGKLPQMPKSLLDWLLENLPRIGERNPSTRSQQATVFESDESSIATIVDTDKHQSILPHSDLYRFVPDACKHISKHKISYSEWVKCGLSLQEMGNEDGKKWFVKMSIDNSHFSDSEQSVVRKWNNLWQSSRGAVNIRTLFYIAQEYGFQYPSKYQKYLNDHYQVDNNHTDEQLMQIKKSDLEFWNVSKKGNVSFDLDRFIAFIAHHGYAKTKLYKNDASHMFVHIDGHFVEQVNITDIKDFVSEYVDNLDTILSRDIKNELINKTRKLFCRETLEHLPSISISMVHDSEKKSFLFFENCYIEILGGKNIRRNYDNLSGYLWRERILTHDYEYADPTGFEFDHFLRCVTNADETPIRYNALCSSIGYLIHKYRDVNTPKAIIYMDEKITTDPFERNGGSGKSLVIDAIQRMRRTTTIDGASFRYDRPHSFAFENVDHETELVEFDDAKKNFDFDGLFVYLTGDFTIEKKWQPKFIIPREYAPKAVITTNHTIQGVGGSYERRKHEIEFTDYFNQEHQPSDEYGHRFFYDWDKHQWNQFYTLMIQYTQRYLETGLVSYEHMNVSERRLFDHTCEEFVEFVRDYLDDDVNFRYEQIQHHDHVPYDLRFVVRDLYNFYRDTYDPDISSQSRFSRWVNIYAKINGWKREKSHSNGQTTIWFIKKEGAKRKDAK